MYQELLLKSVKIQSALQQSKRTLDESLIQLHQSEKDLLLQTERLRVQDDAISKMKLIISSFSSQHIQEVEELVTMALQTVFDDRNYSFKISVSDKRNAKQAEMYLIDDGNQIPLNKRYTAGGILTVVGLVLQIYHLSYLHLPPVIITDESLSQLSDQYLPGLFTLIDRLKRQRDLIIILITHDPRLQEAADRTYKVSNGVYRLEETK